MTKCSASFRQRYGSAKGFSSGSRHRRCKVTKKVMPTYAAFVYAFGRFYESDPMTFAEFQTFDVNDLPDPKP